MRFSVIISFYNIEKYVNKCMDSVISQSFTDFEVIAVDDGSIDNTGKLLDQYAEIDSRIKVIHKENEGVNKARKTAANECVGDYIVIVDGDDWISIDYLEKIDRAITDKDIDVVITGYVEAFEDKSIKIKPNRVNGIVGTITRDDMEKYLFPQLFSTMPVLWAKAFRRDLYVQYQMKVDDSIKMGEDSCIAFPCIINAKCISIVDDTLYYYRQNPYSLTKHPKKYLPWEGTLKRIEFLESVLPLERYDLEQQVAASAVKSIFNTVVSHMKNDNYNIVKKESDKHLKSQYNVRWFDSAISSKNKVAKILAIILKYRFYLIIKFWSIFH